MRLIPWDRLREKSPRLFNLCRRSGASVLYPLRDGGTLYISDWSGVHWHEENLEIEEVMETPEVGSGDLLLLRVNTIHATQMTDDRHLAVSLRTCDPGDADRLASSGRQSHASYDENARKPEPVVFPRFFNIPRKTTSAPLWGTSCRP